MLKHCLKPHLNNSLNYENNQNMSKVSETHYYRNYEKAKQSPWIHENVPFRWYKRGDNCGARSTRETTFSTNAAQLGEGITNASIYSLRLGNNANTSNTSVRLSRNSKRMLLVKNKINK